MNAVEQLCPNCGLCCDSTLFADVELRAGDDAALLEKLGLSLETKGKNKIAFAQPCACFDGKFCKIYSERPKRCRTFECGLLKKVVGGDLTAGGALQKISETKVLAENVRRRLRSLGQQDETAALTHRYAAAMNAPLDLSAGGAKGHGELMLAVHELMQVVQRDFLK